MLFNQEWARSASNRVSVVLRKAAELLETYGHVKFVRKDRDGRMCLLGALQEAQGLDENYRPNRARDAQLTYEAAEAICKTLNLSALTDHYNIEGDYRGAAATWNNRHDVSAQDVIDVMRKTADRVEETEMVSA